MTNRYLVKISEMSAENKQVAKTFAASWLPSIPADIAGGLGGAAIGSKFKGLTLPSSKYLKGLSGHHIPGGTLGGIAGASLLSGATELVGIKHSLHGKIKETN